MSVLTPTRRLFDRAVPTTPDLAPTVAPFRQSVTAEAPDRGQGPAEAPESNRGQTAEAPDAGDTRGGSSDESSTGRSRS